MPRSFSIEACAESAPDWNCSVISDGALEKNEMKRPLGDDRVRYQKLLCIQVCTRSRPRCRPAGCGLFLAAVIHTLSSSLVNSSSQRRRHLHPATTPWGRGGRNKLSLSQMTNVSCWEGLSVYGSTAARSARCRCRSRRAYFTSMGIAYPRTRLLTYLRGPLAANQVGMAFGRPARDRPGPHFQ